MHEGHQELGLAGIKLLPMYAGFHPEFQLYHSLRLVQEYGVWDKVSFGTDYPFTTVDASIDGLRSLNNQLAGTSLPR